MTADESCVVDASVAAKWYVPEPGSAPASAILESGARLLAPDLLVAELGNIMWKKVRRGELAPTEAKEILDAFITTCPVTLYSGSLLRQSALDIAIDFERTVYDVLYLAVAVAEDCPWSPPTTSWSTRFRVPRSNHTCAGLGKAKERRAPRTTADRLSRNG